MPIERMRHPRPVHLFAAALVALVAAATPARAAPVNVRETTAGRVRLTLSTGVGHYGSSLTDPGVGKGTGLLPVFLTVDPQIELGAGFALSTAVRSTLVNRPTVAVFPGFVYHLWAVRTFAVSFRLAGAIVTNGFIGGLQEGVGLVWQFVPSVGVVLEGQSEQYFGGARLKGVVYTVSGSLGLRVAF